MLSIIIPARNEEKRIGPTLEAYGEFLLMKQKEENLYTEIIVVLNDCTDNTLEVVMNYCNKYPFIKYLNLSPPGKGFATIIGFNEALNSNNDLIGFVDADLSTRPEDFMDLYYNLESNDGIIASRWKKESKTERSFGKAVRSKGFNYLVRGLFLFPYEDTQCGAKIFKRKVIEKIVHNIDIPEWAFDVNILYLCDRYNFKIKEHPTIWKDKDGSKINKPFKIPIQMAAGVIRLRLLYSPFSFFVRAYDQLILEDYKIHHW